MTFDPDNKNDVELLVDTIDLQIEDASIDLFEDGHRNHLGASLIGDACSRKLWYTFRWVKKANFSSKTRSYPTPNMRALSEQELKLFLEKVQKYIGASVRHLIDRADEPHVFRLHNDRVYYVSESLLKKGKT